MRATADPFDPRVALLEPFPDVRVWLNDACTVFGLISPEDAGWVLRSMWSLHIDQRGKDYARHLRTAGGRRVPIYLHREVMLRVSPPPTAAHLYVDHINGRGTDNRRSNLRWVTASENARNVNGLCYRQPVLHEGAWL